MYFFYLRKVTLMIKYDKPNTLPKISISSQLPELPIVFLMAKSLARPPKRHLHGTTCKSSGVGCGVFFKISKSFEMKWSSIYVRNESRMDVSAVLTLTQLATCTFVVDVYTQHNLPSIRVHKSHHGNSWCHTEHCSHFSLKITHPPRNMQASCWSMSNWTSPINGHSSDDGKCTSAHSWGGLKHVHLWLSCWRVFPEGLVVLTVWFGKLRVWEVFFVQKTHKKTQLLSFSACCSCSCWELACQIQRSEDFASRNLSYLLFQACSPFDWGGWSCSYTRCLLFMLQLAQVRLETEPKKNVIYGSIFGCKNFRNHRKKGNIFSLWLHCLTIKLHQLTPCFCKLS